MALESRLVDYKKKKALVVDDYPSMRSGFKMALASFGMTKVDLAASASEAVVRVKGGSYDVIVCDYNLGEGRDGQQLLEELRHRDLITLQTAFLMVTAESVYERVVAAAELAPDDYLIKPFNGEILRTRLDAILLKKDAFAKVHRAFILREMEAALDGCDAIIKEYPKYVVDALRFKGEILVALGDFEGAEALYKQVIAMRAVPWCRLGLAKSLHLQNRDVPAEEVLLDLMDQHPELVAGYDLLADVQLSQNKMADAQRTLERGVQVSAKSPRRQRRLGELAYRNKDMATAEAAFKTAIDKGRNSIFLAPNDFANLARVQVERGRVGAARDLIANNRKILQESDEGRLVSAVVQARVDAREGKIGDARKAMAEAMRLKSKGLRCEPELLMDMVESCVKADMESEAAELLSEVARNAHDSVELLDKARAIYTEAGKAEQVAEILQKSTANVARLSREGALLLQKGDLPGGVARMLEAAREAPRNPRVLMNTVWAILRRVEQDKSAVAQLADARRLLDDAAWLVPEHTRLGGLRTRLRQMENDHNARRVAAMMQS